MKTMNHNFTISEISSYSSEFSNSKFWGKIRSAAKQAGEQVVYYAFVLYYELTDPTVSIMEKAVLYGALGYFILPVDLIPDWLIGIGYVDDLTVLKMAFKYIKSHVTDYVENSARAKAKEWLE